MRRVLILVSLFLLIGSLTFSASALQPDAQLLTDAGHTAALQGDEEPPVPPDDDGDEAEGLLAGVRDLLGQVLAILTNEEPDNSAVEAYPVEAAPEEAVPVEEEPAAEEAAPVEEVDEAEAVEEAEPVDEVPADEVVDPDSTAEAGSREETLQKAEKVKEMAEEAIGELLSRTELSPDGADADDESVDDADSGESVEEAVEETAEGLLAQAQELLAEIAGEEPMDDQAIIQEWMPSMPDCDAPPAPMVNWSHCDKSGIELNGANLEGAILVETDFSDAFITNTDMSGANMKMADFSEAVLDNVLMRGSNLAWADFTDSLLLFVDMTYADASSANFSGSNITVLLAREAKLMATNFTNTLMYFNDFSHSDLNSADFGGSVAAINFFRGSNLEMVNFAGVQLLLYDLTGANVEWVDLSGATLNGVWFKSATGEPAASSVDLDAFNYICPDGTYFAGQTTTDAQSLCDWGAAPSIPPAPSDVIDCAALPAPGVNWSGCDKTTLSDPGLDLRNANLQGTLFSGNNMFMWDLSGADLSGAQLDGGFLTFSSLFGADLPGANLNDRAIYYSNLDSTDLSGADLSSITTLFNTVRDSDLNGATLDLAQLLVVDLSFANLQDASATGLLSSMTRMRGANLNGLNLTDAAQDMLDASLSIIEATDLSNQLFNDGIWFKFANGVPTSSVDLNLQQTLICPAGDAVFGPLTIDAPSLCEWSECVELVEDGDFELQSDAWDLPVTEYPAEFSQDQAYSPDWSARTGIVDSMDNTYSFSSVRQTVTLPAGMTNAILTFYLYPQTDEPMSYLIPDTMEQALSIKGAKSSMGPHGSHVGDAQWVIIYDNMGHELMRPVNMRSNTQTWELYEVDISKLVDPMMDREIELYFGTFNNGYEGVTAMYVDDVSIGNCKDIPKPEPPQPPQIVCSDTIVNGGFETQDGSWLLPVTPMPADYSSALYNSGAWSMRTGIVNPDMNRNSFSSALQRVTIPKGATSADLSFYLYQQSTEDPNMLIPESIEMVLAPTAMEMMYGDAQWVLILDQHLRELERLVSTRSNEQTWRFYEGFDLTKYEGRTILLYFGTFNNGWDGQTAMYVDDVVLDVCAPEAP